MKHQLRRLSDRDNGTYSKKWRISSDPEPMG
jgi:hypothetical protein